MAVTRPNLGEIANLIRSGQQTAENRWEELREDFEKKHQENRERRHAMAGEIQLVKDQYFLLSERLTAAEKTLLTVVGDNSGGSGLLHAIDKKVDELKTDVTALKAAVQDAPAIRKWVYGAMAIVGLLVIILPILAVIGIELLKFLLHH